MNKILEKWEPIMDALGVSDDDKKIKMSEYAEHFIEMFNDEQVISEQQVAKKLNSLPLSLKILKDLNDFHQEN